VSNLGDSELELLNSIYGLFCFLFFLIFGRVYSAYNGYSGNRWGVVLSAVLRVLSIDES
jgi:hypothetical protein